MLSQSQLETIYLIPSGRASDGWRDGLQFLGLCGCCWGARLWLLGSTGPTRPPEPFPQQELLTPRKTRGDPLGCCRADSGGHWSTSQPPPQRPLLRGASPAFLGASQEVDPRDFDASRVTLGVVTCHCAEAWIGGVAPGGWADGVSTGRRESPASAGQRHLPSLPWRGQRLCPGEAALCREAGPCS